MGDAELMALLKGVSRSFFITIKALPGSLRRPIGLAYLLARASDTIADSSECLVSIRMEALRAFVPALLHEHEELFTLAGEIRPASSSERYLLGQIARVFALLDRLSSSDRDEIITLLRKITRGQELDLLRFPDRARVRALDSGAELDEYTYLVAGCVGEFWTRLCAAHLPRYSRVDLDTLAQLGRSFGQGLQLVNILRDFPEDLANGRCYLPMSELRPLGILSPEELCDNLRLAAPVYEAWRQKALLHHSRAREYIESIRPWRIRFACLVPWALGVRTLNLIAEQSPLDRGPRVKVSRGEVSRIIRRAFFAAISDRSIRAWANG